MHRLVHWLWRTVQCISIFVLIVIVVYEGASIFRVLFDDAIGRRYSIEFRNSPTQIVYTEKSWWFGPTWTYVIRAEKDEDSEDEEDVWSMRELKGTQLGDRENLFNSPDDVGFQIRPYYGNTED
jgi:hypothetical protein